jgi:hypothetical protein
MGISDMFLFQVVYSRSSRNTLTLESDLYSLTLLYYIIIVVLVTYDHHVIPPFIYLRCRQKGILSIHRLGIQAAFLFSLGLGSI